ncbi:MAG: hypothetical protein KKB51_04430, partial [Candidatus Riflebacteria bacterium]|nr:hypothetical protein [Candidatus Riflebacteria bacterium]
MKSFGREFNHRRGWMSFYAFMIAVVLAFYVAGTQISSIDQNQAYRLRIFEAQSIQAADSALAFALRDTATHGGSWGNMELP